MSNTISIRNLTQVAGKNLTDTRAVTADNLIDSTETVPAGVAGVAGLAGAMTSLPTGHGLTDADIVCVTWAAGYRYNCTLSSTGANATTVAAGAGDTLPTSGAVVISKQAELDVGVLGTNLAYLFLGCDVAAVITLESTGAVEIAVSVAAGGAYQWDSGTGIANPVTGDAIVKSHYYAKTATAGTAQLFMAYDND